MSETPIETGLREALSKLVGAVELLNQPLVLSGEYDPPTGKFGQSTATLPDGTKVERYAYLREAREAAKGWLPKAPCAACGRPWVKHCNACGDETQLAIPHCPRCGVDFPA